MIYISLMDVKQLLTYYYIVPSLFLLSINFKIQFYFSSSQEDGGILRTPAVEGETSYQAETEGEMVIDNSEDNYEESQYESDIYEGSGDDEKKSSSSCF